MIWGNLKYFLGLEVTGSTKGISLSQRHYALQFLSDVRYLGCKTRKTPMDPKVWWMIKKLLYLTIIRSDLSFAINHLSFLQNWGFPTCKQFIECFNTSRPQWDKVFFFSSFSLVELKAFADSNWGACSDTRKSISGLCAFIRDSLVS